MPGWGFPGGPVVKTLLSMQGHRVNPWSGNKDPTCCVAQSKKKKMPDSNTITKIIMIMADTYEPLLCALY